MDDLSEFAFNVPASAQAFMDISAFMDANHISEPLIKIVTQALYDWMAAQIAAKDFAVSTEPRGYQWKQVFLPDGTCLRTIVNGEHITARVSGNSVIYDQCGLKRCERKIRVKKSRIAYKRVEKSQKELEPENDIDTPLLRRSAPPVNACANLNEA